MHGKGQNESFLSRPADGSMSMASHSTMPTMGLQEPNASISYASQQSISQTSMTAGMGMGMGAQRPMGMPRPAGAPHARQSHAAHAAALCHAANGSDGSCCPASGADPAASNAYTTTDDGHELGAAANLPTANDGSAAADACYDAAAATATATATSNASDATATANASTALPTSGCPPEHSFLPFSSTSPTGSAAYPAVPTSSTASGSSTDKQHSRPHVLLLGPTNLFASCSELYIYLELFVISIQV